MSEYQRGMLDGMNLFGLALCVPMLLVCLGLIFSDTIHDVRHWWRERRWR